MERVPGVKLLSTPGTPAFDAGRAMGSLAVVDGLVLEWTSAAGGKPIKVPLVGASEWQSAGGRRSGAAVGGRRAPHAGSSCWARDDEVDGTHHPPPPTPLPLQSCKTAPPTAPS